MEGHGGNMSTPRNTKSTPRNTRSALRSTYHVARADFLQRVRSRRFLAVLAVVVSLGYLVNVGGLELVYQQPAGGYSYDNYYGEPNAAWIGAKAALTGTFFLTLAGFYLSKNTLAREERTGVSHLLPSMPISNRRYLLGKWLSNVAVAVTIVTVLAASTVVIHAVHGVGPTAVVPLVGPLFLLAVPVGCVVGGVALLFETVDLLDGSLGNVLYFCGAVAVMAWASSVSVENGTASAVVTYVEPLGYVAVYVATYDALLAAAPNYAAGVPTFGQAFGDPHTFTWAGGSWPTWIYPKRAAFVVVGCTVALLGTITFDRFADDGGSRRSLRASLPVIGRSDNADSDNADSNNADSDNADDSDDKRTTAGRVETPSEPTEVNTPTESTASLAASLTPVTNRGGGGLGRLVVAEARIALTGHRWWWYAGGFLLAALGLAPITSLGFDRGVVVTLALVWPVFVLSEIGVRTHRHRTRELVVSSMHPVGQLVSEWLVGVAVLGVLMGGVALPHALAGETGVLLGYVATLLFVPSLALAAGVWTETTRTFEAVYLSLWFVGPVNDVAPLDFAVTTAAVPVAVPIAFSVVGILLLAVGLSRRSRYLH
jgi:ABC-type transport system involved in multi-copper enzyme maturation permease subunit